MSCVRNADESAAMRALNSDKDFVSWCRARGLRVTGRRRTVAKVVAEARDYPDVLELHRRIAAFDSRISLATVYRSLRLFAEYGLIEGYTFRGNRTRSSPAREEHKDHLIDISTGRVIEFRSGEIERLQGEVAARLGCRLTSHKLELYGEPVRTPKRQSLPIDARRPSPSRGD